MATKKKTTPKPIKKASTKKTSTKKTSTKKTSTKKTSTKKAPKETSTKKAAPKKTKAAPKTTSTKKAAPKKASTTSNSSVEARRQALMASDARLGKHIEKVGAYGLEPEGLTSVYESLARSIVYQQLTGKAAATIYGRLEKLGKDGLPTPAEIAALDDTALRSAGLSGSKVKALRDLAHRQHTGLLPSAEEAAALDDEVLIETLSAVRGIGPWSVQMLLMFRLGRPDVMPATDYGVQKGFQKVYGKGELPKPKELLAYAERWRPHRSMAAWYLWRALDS